MGCGSAKDAEPKVTDAMIAKTLQTNILQFDQIFLVIAEELEEAEKARLKVIPARENMIRLTKAHHLEKPTLCDAYRIWTQCVSACNEGRSSDFDVAYQFNETSFQYGLGQCGDVKLDWFGDMLSNYLSGLKEAKKEFPEVKEKCEAMFDKIKGMKNEIFSFLGPFEGSEKYKAVGLVVANMAILGRSLAIANEFLKRLDEYDQELFELTDKHLDIEREADEVGSKIYNDYPPIPVPKLKERQLKVQFNILNKSEQTKFRLGTKMNNIVYYYSKGARRTLVQEQEEQALKADRRANSKWNVLIYIYHLGPCKVKNPDDVNNENKKDFPYRLRWTGSAVLDIPLTQLSSGLEDLNFQKQKLKHLRNMIRQYTQVYRLKDDNMTEAWRVFCWYLGAEQGDLKNKGLKMKDECPPYCLGLEKIECKDTAAEEVRKLFLEYFSYVFPSRTNVLKEQWEKFDKCDEQLKGWMSGNFAYDPLFQSCKCTDQYNIMTNLSKNIYAMINYKQRSTEIYEKRYKRMANEGDDVWRNAEQIMYGADEKKEAKGVPFRELVNKVHDGSKRDETKLKQVKEKVEKYFAENQPKEKK